METGYLICLQKYAQRFLSIPAGSAWLLIVALDGFWQGVVEDKSDVRLVHSHPEGDGGAHDVDTVLDPIVLNRASLGVCHAQGLATTSIFF